MLIDLDRAVRGLAGVIKDLDVPAAARTTVLAALAEWSEREKAGAPKRGRPPILVSEQLGEIEAHLTMGMGVEECARAFGISSRTLRRRVDVARIRASAVTVPAAQQERQETA